MSRQTRGATNRHLTLTLDNDLFALEITCVREILDMTEVTRIPQAPRAVKGVVNVRGSAIPVVDLRLRFGIEETARTVHTRIVVVETPSGDSVAVLGVIADSVKEVLELAPESISEPPGMGNRVPREFLLGVAKNAGRFILILDIDKVLGTSDAPPQSNGAPAQSPGGGGCQHGG